MEHFKVLPTDERFLKLTEQHIDMLYSYFLMKPEDIHLKEWYVKNKQVEQVV